MNHVRLVTFAALLTFSGVLLSACPRPMGYQGVRVFPQVDLKDMTALAFVPDSDQALVSTVQGVVYSIDMANDTAPPTVFLDISDRIIEDPGNEEGLLGLAVNPDFAANGIVYLHYTAGDPRRGVIASFESEDGVADASSEELVIQIPQPYDNHNGGAIVFGPDGYLYIGVGDGGGVGDPDGNGQDQGDVLGAILRIDAYRNGYTIPPDNPFVNGPGRAEVWAWGFRNPWRISFDSATGDLWAGDVGQGDWEEVNRVVRAGNHGWNATEGFVCYRDRPCDPAAYVAPRAVFETHDDEGSCAVIGGHVYRGQSMPELVGWYVYGDFCTGRIWAVNVASADGPAVPLLDGRSPIFSFAEGPDGEIYILSLGGGIYRLAPL